MDAHQSIQLLSMIFSLVGIIGWSLWAGIRSRHRKWGYAIPPISWLIHTFIFYGTIFYRGYFGIRTGSQYINDWSSVVKLHGILLVVGVGVIFLVMAYMKRGEKGDDGTWTLRLLL